MWAIVDKCCIPVPSSPINTEVRHTDSKKEGPVGKYCLSLKCSFQGYFSILPPVLLVTSKPDPKLKK